MLWSKLVRSHVNHCFESINIARAGFDDLIEYSDSDLFGDSAILKIKSENRFGIYGVVREDLELLFVLGIGSVHVHFVDGVHFDIQRHFMVEHGSGSVEQLAGREAVHIARKLLVFATVADCQLFIEFISSDGVEIILLRVEKHIVDKRLSAFNVRRLSRAQLFVDILERFFAESRLGLFRFGGNGVLFEGGADLNVIAEHFENVVVAFNTERAYEYGYRDLAVFVDSDIEYVVCVGLVFKPCAAVRNDG